MTDAVATIDLPYIENNLSRHGTVRRYLRYDGKRYGRLPDDTESQEFTDEYWRLRKIAEGEAPAQAAPDDPSGPPKPNTFRWLCVEYLRSDAFQTLDSTTRHKRRRIIDSMLLEPVKPGGSRLFANMPLPVMDAANVQVLRDRKAETPFAADERLKVLGQVFDTTRPGRDGRPEPIVKINPARQVKRFRKKTEGWHTITGVELAQYIRHHGVRSKAVLAVIILMFTGMRVSDLQAVGPQHRRKDKLIFRVFKGRNRHPVTLEIDIHPVLGLVLGWHPAKGMNYLMTDYGEAYSIKGLSQRVSAWFDQAGLPHCSAHTVRKGLATLLAESEATDSMLDGLFGWKDGKTSKIYTRRKEQARLARQAVSRIDWNEIGDLLPALADSENEARSAS